MLQVRKGRRRVTNYASGRSRTQLVPLDRQSSPNERIINPIFDTNAVVSGTFELQESSSSAYETGKDAGQSKYDVAKQKEVLSWTERREEFSSCYMESFNPVTFVCTKCNCIDHNIIYCRDCGPGFYMCENCFLLDHQCRPFHYVYKWNGSLFFKFNVPLTLRKLHTCNEALREERHITIIDKHGVSHDAVIQICSCVSYIKSILDWKLWPAHSDSNIVVQQELLENAHYLLLCGHVSSEAFVSYFKDKNHLSETEVARLYRVLTGECLHEFRRQFQQHRDLCSVVMKDMFCPACPKERNAFERIDSLHTSAVRAEKLDTKGFSDLCANTKFRCFCKHEAR